MCGVETIHRITTSFHLRKEQITVCLIDSMDDATYERLKGELGEVHERLERVHQVCDELERKFSS